MEIVSVDSMAVYRGMDIGTATPSASEQALVSHHLIDILDPWEECTVGLFAREAARAEAGIAERGGLPLFVGGTGLYHRAVIDELEIPGQHPEVRERLEAEAAELGTAALFERLSALDPMAASRMEPGNQRRIVRALEVIEGEGRPFSAFGPGLDAYAAARVVQIGVDPGDAALRERIGARVAGWVEAGLIDEVRALSELDRPLSRTAAQAIGYAELLAHLRGELGLDEALERTTTRSWQLAKRQRSWFRRDPRVRWTVEVEQAAELAASALAGLRQESEVRQWG